MQCLGSESALVLVGWIRFREGKNAPKNRKMFEKCHGLTCWMFTLRAEGVSCCLNVLYGALGISKLQFGISKRYQLYNFIQFLVIKTLDFGPDPQWPKMLDPDMHWNQCGSVTMHKFILWCSSWPWCWCSPHLHTYLGYLAWNSP